MRVCVTGATGFLGRHVLAALAAAGHDAVGVARRPERAEGLPVPVLRGDVRDPASLAAAVEGADAVIHAAGGVAHGPDAGRAMHDAHVRGTEGALAAARAAGARRFVHVSSSGTVAVGRTMEVRSEAAPRPLDVVAGWPYYRAKLFAEEAALRADGAGFAVVVLNPALLLGPPAPEPFGGGVRSEAAEEVLEPLRSGRLPLAPGGGISVVDARDVAAACVAALTRGTPGERYLLASANWTFSDFYGRAARAAGWTAPAAAAPRGVARLLALLPRPPAALPADPAVLVMAEHCFWADAQKAKAALGFAPREPLDTLAGAV